MNRKTILVRGPAVRAAIVGALVALRCAGPSCVVLIVAEDDPDGSAAMLARPDWQRFHDEIGLPGASLAKLPSAKPAPATHIPGEGLAVPFAPIGESKGGAEFHQYWLRANRLESQPPLLSFAPHDPIAAGLAHGLVIERNAYAALLLHHAASLGAQIVQQSDTQADLTIDCAAQDAGAVWDGNKLRFGAFPDVPGLEWQGLYNAAKRLLALSAAPSQSAPEQREFNRLSAAELERMADFAEACAAPAPDDTQRPALRRKLDLFRACGRIAREDYEVFAPHEWLALFWAKDLRPGRYDRLADVMPDAELLSWLKQLHHEAQASTQGNTQGSKEAAA